MRNRKDSVSGNLCALVVVYRKEATVIKQTVVFGDLFWKSVLNGGKKRKKK